MSIDNQYKIEVKLLSERIRDLRKERVLTQKQLKELSGITQSQISLLENTKEVSNPEFDTLIKLAIGLKVQLTDLFNYGNKSVTPIYKSTYRSIEKRSSDEKILFGQRVEDLHKHRKLKQDEFSILARIDAADLSRYIHGDGNIEFYSIIKIAVALEIPTIMLFDYEGELPDNKKFKGRL